MTRMTKGDIQIVPFPMPDVWETSGEVQSTARRLWLEMAADGVLTHGNDVPLKRSWNLLPN
jgi:hypothetical protein